MKYETTLDLPFKEKSDLITKLLKVGKDEDKESIQITWSTIKTDLIFRGTKQQVEEAKELMQNYDRLK